MPSATFTIDSVIATRRFTLDSFIVGNRVQHDRTLDHTGVEDATTVVLAAPIGQYAAGTTIQDVLASMVARFVALESSNHRYGFFAFDAFIKPHFWLNAVIARGPTSSFTLDAVRVLAGVKTFTLNAAIRAGSSGGARSFSLDAFLV